ncbi:MAG: bifunctional 5,10-methylenetetrahydrofolate dehydrogenase/5,10-methenyltetrahydrofolate cyclohydrolase [Phycisphaerales bacterium]|jgi:methylenetetrahydrofolate dehydrogenase (NADP+) / methenyltetrahydrofolate cyclohydrolase|nr:bifunctional 5,10-methylenetetrahydrofolate dehydrogenase/5,10-methenyltetrahydrofolate cyclohydrolase [Phycisphaerales bacterium]
MTASIIDGKKIAAELAEQITRDAAELKAAGAAPRLVAIQVGENPASKIYTNMQARQCESVGIEYDLRNLSDETTQDQLLAEIETLNSDPSVSGMILQMPLPDQIDSRAVQTAIAPGKDVEGMGATNMGHLFYGGKGCAPCTAVAAVELLKRTCDDLGGKEAVIVGHSEIVGKPIAMMLLQSLRESPTVTVCHVATQDLAFHTRRADVLFVAAGVSQAKWRGASARAKKTGEPLVVPDLSPLISADMIKPGAIVIDVAINRIPKGFDENGQPLKNDKGRIATKTVGDVDFDGAMEIASAITPVPGGVGPLTVMMLLKNTVTCAQAISS